MTESAEIKGETIQVGSTGTIGSLMTRELESMKNTQWASINSEKKTQSAPVSVPCGARRNPRNEAGSSSGIGNGSACSSSKSENGSADRRTREGKMGKKGSSFIVEVVDLKCNNPMGSRLKKLGFSKLSESVV